jgi:predicted Zn-dependent protease
MLHIRLESAFARVTQAYETLMDSSLRTAYDNKLAANKDLAARTTPKAASNAADGASGNRRAEDNFTDGLAALQQGQIKRAIGLLAAAARALPNEARYRAYYGKALAANSKTRHSAEVELQAAIRLEPSNAGFRVMLAELYRDLGFAKRAQGEAKRALGIDPGNAEAKALLKNLS